MLILITELIQRLDTILQRPDVAKTGISRSHDLRTHGVRSDREVQATEAARHGHTVQTGLHHRIQVLLRARGILHTAIGAMRTLRINTLRIRSDNLTRDLTGDLQHLVIRIHGVSII